MSKKGKKSKMHSVDQRADKKAVVLGTERKSHRPLIMMVAFAALVVGGAVLFLDQFAGKGPSTASATQITYPVDRFDDGKAQHFQFKADDGITIRYFVLKSSDGVIRAAFDACDVCWPSGKGYYQDGDYMVCRNCGKRFASVKVNEVRGGCNPAPLTRQIVDGNLVIQVKDMLEGRQYFDFPKGG